MTGVLLIAALGWAVGTRLRSPADEAALRKAPKASLITVPVVRRKLTSTAAVSGTLAYGSPVPVFLAGVVGGAVGSVGGGTADAQRVTRPPRPGTIREGSVLMEVNGRPVFVLKGAVPMHRTIAPGSSGADVRQLQRALRRLGTGAPASGVFDQATIAAVQRWYAKRGYKAQEPDLTARQTLEQLRAAVRTAHEALVTDSKALDQGREVLPLKVKVDNARHDLASAKAALKQAEGQEVSPEDARRLLELRRAVRTAEEELLAAEQALAAAKPEDDRRLLELKMSNAQADLDSARASIAAFAEEASAKQERLLEELSKAVRTAKESLVTAEQALRQARDTSPLKLKVADDRKALAGARTILTEFLSGYGTSIPPGEIVFLASLPARLDKAAAKAGLAVEGKIGTVTSSTFAVTGSVETKEADLLRKGMKATIETADGQTYPAALTAFGPDAATADVEGGGSEGGDKTEGPGLGSVPVILTPTARKGLRALVGVPVTVKIAVGATEGAVLTVPVAAVVTSADGKPRVQVEAPGERTRDIEVTTGLTADGNVEVTSPSLKEGDRVVVGNA